MKHNYANYSKPTNKPEEVTPAVATVEEELPVEETIEEPIEETANDELPVEEAIEEPIKEETVVPPPAPVDGVVTTGKLNVRKFPSVNAQVLTIINKGDTVQIDPSASTAEWHKVYTTSGLDGYCMKKFIEVK